MSSRSEASIGLTCGVGLLAGAVAVTVGNGVAVGSFVSTSLVGDGVGDAAMVAVGDGDGDAAMVAVGDGVGDASMVAVGDGDAAVVAVGAGLADTSVSGRIVGAGAGWVASATQNCLNAARACCVAPVPATASAVTIAPATPNDTS